MAASTLRVSTPNTATGPLTSGTFTPSLSELLTVVVLASDYASNTDTLTSSLGGGFTFTKIPAATVSRTLNAIRAYVYVADQLIGAGQNVSQSVTFTPDAADPTTGDVIVVVGDSGMTNVGAAAVRQVSTPVLNGAAVTTPSGTFAAATLTGNPLLAVLVGSNPPTITPPAGWTELVDTGYNTPSTGVEIAVLDAGGTATTYTWGSTTSTTWSSVIVEIDASAPAADTYFRRRGANYRR